MAIRRDELTVRPQSRAVVYRFPTGAVRRRAAAQRRRAPLSRFAMAAALFAGALLLAVHLAGAPAAASRAGAPAAVTVAPGETLWDIAQRYEAAGTDPRAYVARLERINSLDGPVDAGERIRLPR